MVFPWNWASRLLEAFKVISDPAIIANKAGSIQIPIQMDHMKNFRL